MIAMELLDRVRAEVEALHEFFVGWFSGQLPAGEFERSFLRRFDDGFILIPPAGVTLTLAELADSLRQSYGSNPQFRIAIRNVQIRQQFGEHVLATYEEWQRNAVASEPPDNARVATVLFRAGKPMRWLHVHETWLPESVSSAGPYDF